MKNLITFYTNHYFNNEHDLTKLKLPNAWIFEAINGKTISTLLELNLLNPQSLRDLQKHFNCNPDDEAATIIGLQFYDNANKSEIAKTLYDYGVDLISQAQGDDDCFDYTPITIDAIINLISQLEIPESKSYITDLNNKTEILTQDEDEDED